MTAADKRCAHCGNIKPLEDFSLNRSKSLGRHCFCKACSKTHGAIMRRLHKAHKPPENHTCPICDRGELELRAISSKRGSPWRLDHDHETEEFRGFLCDRCNLGLGKFNDDVELLKRALQYLES